MGPNFRRGIGLFIFGVAAFVAAVWATTPAPRASETADIKAFDEFVAIIGPFCQERASLDCANYAWAFADRDSDDSLTQDELTILKEDLRAWTLWKEDGLPGPTRNGIFLGLLIAEGLGIPQMIQTYDDDQDGQLTRKELFQDVKLDERPLEDVLDDPQAFDRDAFTKRLGPMGPLFQALGK